jgi:hypothetical protein
MEEASVAAGRGGVYALPLWELRGKLAPCTLAIIDGVDVRAWDGDATPRL